MESLDGCALRNSSALEDAKCEAGARSFFREAAAVTRFWRSSVEFSGGVESTKNRKEQTNLSEAAWILEGAVAGLRKLYPERFDADGNKLSECETITGDIVTKYGEEECAPVIEAYKASVGTTCEGTEACNAAISCRLGNDPAAEE